jgi:hypothetical protein
VGPRAVERLERAGSERHDEMRDSLVPDLDAGLDRRHVGHVVADAAGGAHLDLRTGPINGEGDRGTPAVEHDDSGCRVDERPGRALRALERRLDRHDEDGRLRDHPSHEHGLVRVDRVHDLRGLAAQGHRRPQDGRVALPGLAPSLRVLVEPAHPCRSREAEAQRPDVVGPVDMGQRIR